MRKRGCSAALGVALAVAGCGGGGHPVEVTGTIAPVTASSTEGPFPISGLTVVAIDETGQVVDSDTTADRFSLTLPPVHDYVIAFRSPAPNGITLAVLALDDRRDSALFSLTGAELDFDLGSITFQDAETEGGIGRRALSEHPLGPQVPYPPATRADLDHDGDLIPDFMDRDDDNDGIDDLHDDAPLTYEPHNIDLVACPASQASGGLTLFDASATITRAMDLALRNVLVMSLLFDQLGMTEFAEAVDTLPSPFADVANPPSIPTNEEIDRALAGSSEDHGDLAGLDAYAIEALTRAAAGSLRSLASILGYVENETFDNVTSQPNFRILKRLNDSTNGTATLGIDTTAGGFHNGSGNSVPTAERDQAVVDYYRDIARLLRSLGIQSIDDPDDPTTVDAAVAETQGFLDPANYTTPDEFLAAYGALRDETDVCASFSERGSRWSDLMAIFE